MQVPSAQTLTVYLNSQKEALSNYHVHQTLGWALDHEELIRLSMEGLSESVTTWLGSNPAYEELKTLFFDSYNVEKAAKLMDEAGWKLVGS